MPLETCRDASSQCASVAARGCKRKMRELRWAAERKFDEWDCTRNGSGAFGGGGIVARAVSGGAGDGDFLQRVAAGGGAADVDE
jgi:hypothetical protein